MASGLARAAAAVGVLVSLVGATMAAARAPNGRKGSSLAPNPLPPPAAPPPSPPLPKPKQPPPPLLAPPLAPLAAAATAATGLAGSRSRLCEALGPTTASREAAAAAAARHASPWQAASGAAGDVSGGWGGCDADAVAAVFGVIVVVGVTRVALAGRAAEGTSEADDLRRSGVAEVGVAVAAWGSSVAQPSTSGTSQVPWSSASVNLRFARKWSVCSRVVGKSPLVSCAGAANRRSKKANVLDLYMFGGTLEAEWAAQRVRRSVQQSTERSSSSSSFAIGPSPAALLHVQPRPPGSLRRCSESEGIHTCSHQGVREGGRSAGR